MKKFKLIKTITARFSVTQADLAAYLGISRSLLAMYEKRLRSLPTSATLKLARLEMLHNQIRQEKLEKQGRAEVHPDVIKHYEKIRKSRESRSAICKYRKILLQQQLEDMKANYARAEIWLQMINHLLENTPRNKENKGDRLWLEVQQPEAVKKLIRYGYASQAKLQAKIIVLEAEEKAYKNAFV